MLIVSDTGPLRYLVEIGVVDVLPLLYGQVLTTPQVIAELRVEYFPTSVRLWADNPPVWLQVLTPAAVSFRDRLDEGEASAISLAIERKASHLLMDERAGREIARRVGLELRGTLGVIVAAGALGYTDFEHAIQSLTGRTRFRHTAALIAEARQQYEQLRRW